MPKNYYIVLGIPSDCSQEDIKAAYRRLAKEFHPDRYGQNQTPFQAIHEAYSVLIDPKSRKTYDNSLLPPGSGGVAVRRTPSFQHGPDTIEPLIPRGDSVRECNVAVDRSVHHQFSIFETVFDSLLGGYTEQNRPEGNRGEDIYVTITLSPAQAQRGGNVRLNLPFQMHCPSCYRYGMGNYMCWRCNGTGILKGERAVLVSYPSGITHNHTMRMDISDTGGRTMHLRATFLVH